MDSTVLQKSREFSLVRKEENPAKDRNPPCGQYVPHRHNAVIAIFRLVTYLLICAALLLPPWAALAADAPDSHESIVKAATKEGNLYVYGSLDNKTARLLTNAFQALYPTVKVDFIDMPTAEVFSRHMGDIASNRVSADILWNGDITLQAPIVTDGYALPYRPAPPRDSSVTPLAYLGDSAFVTAFEPVVFVYNRQLASEKGLPTTRKLILPLFEKAELRGKIATCDPEKNTMAFLLLTQDMAYGEAFWKMVVRLGDAGVKFYPDYASLLDGIASGEVLAGYNLPLSTVLKKAAKDNRIDWFYTTDYTLLIPQTLVISKRATNPNAARLWVDFVQSGKAQQIIAENCNLMPVDKTVAGGEMKKLGRELPGGRALKMIGVGAEVARFNASGLRAGFLLRWKQKLKLVK